MNKYKTFNHELNQADNKKQWYACTLFASAMNLYYNCGIKLTEQDLDIIAEEQAKAGLFFYDKGAKAQDSVNAVLRYIAKNSKERGWTIPRLISTINDVDVRKYQNEDYMVMIGISVNSKFKEDVLDGKIDTIDYKNLKGNDLKHYFNIIKDNQEKGFDTSIVDNYFFNAKGRPNLYSCNQKELLEDIDQNMKYIFKY